MAHRSRNLARLEERRRKLRVRGVRREVDDRPVPANIKNSVVVRRAHVRELLCARELRLHRRVVQELDAVGVVLEGLRGGWVLVGMKRREEGTLVELGT